MVPIALLAQLSPRSAHSVVIHAAKMEVVIAGHMMTRMVQIFLQWGAVRSVVLVTTQI